MAITFSTADCDVFARNPKKVKWPDEVSEADRKIFIDIRDRVQQLAKQLASSAKLSLGLKPLTSLYEVSGRSVTDIWCCVYPSSVPNKSYAFQVALIISQHGAEMCFCAGAGRAETFTAARAEAEKIVRAHTESAGSLSVLALIDAELGQKEKAIQEGRAACNLEPVEKDAVLGVLWLNDLARIYALTDEKDLALQQLEIVSKLPNGPSYGELRLDPEWDALRGDPRFEKIVASLAPKKASP